MASDLRCTDPVVLDMWHVICAVGEIPQDGEGRTPLLEEMIGFDRQAGGEPRVWLEAAQSKPGAARRELAWRIAHGYLWTTLGSPRKEVFAIPEYAELDRRNLNAATLGVHTSAPRAIENFLDMAHFPYVHTGILGAEPHTEVPEYDVEISEADDEILATRCRFFQPLAAATAAGGAFVDYVYRVPHPYCAVLYKTSPLDPSRRDVIGIFLQPVEPERVRAHLLLSLLDDRNDVTTIRRFQQLIFGQDKPILENQFPRRLPLDPRAETPIRADKSAVAYRRWLRQKGIAYGTIPAAG